MIPGALYEAALEAGGIGSAILVQEEGGRRFPLPIDRWLGTPDPADERLLADVVGPVLDVGCGPGRHTRALLERGIGAVGVESAPEAARFAQRYGTPVLEGSIFDIPIGADAWRTALLLDGNIGIDGDPVRLLERMAQLLVPDGTVLVELEAPGTGFIAVRVRLEDARRRTPWRPWARVGVDAIDDCAREAGLEVVERWRDEGRWFCALRAAAPTTP